MNLNDKIELFNTQEGGWAKRIAGELSFAASLSIAKNHCYDATVEQAADTLLAAMERDGGVITKAAALAAEEQLLPLKSIAKSYRVHCVSHAHIDMNWMWGYQETAAITVDTFRTVLDLMKEYPALTFGQSQASAYRIVEDYAPELLEEIKERIREGRWEVTASTWVETDKNMPCGESLARHILYTKRYLSKLLAIHADSLKLDFEPDTFGHNLNVPEICAKGGIQYYYHCRGNGDDDFAYRWRSPSGAELLVWREPAWYNFTINNQMFRNVPQLCERYGLDTFLAVYGVGDHGGGPTRRDVERILKMAAWPIMPTVLFSTYGAFFKELEAYRERLPIREGELNYVFTGCYTSQSRIKLANRIAEDRIYESELLAAEANLLAGAPDRKKSFAKAWENILFNHFHDILPGSGVIDTREYALGMFQRSMAAIQTNANLSMRALAAAIDTSAIEWEPDTASTAEGAGGGFMTGQANRYQMPAAERGLGKKRILHLFNTTQYDFDGVTEVTLWDWNYPSKNAVFTDVSGNPAPALCLSTKDGYWGHRYQIFALTAKVPAFGYATYLLDCKEEGDYVAPVGWRFNFHTDDYTDDNLTLENSKLRAIFDHRTMQLISLVDKATERELIQAPAATFRLIAENTVHGMTSWRVGDYMTVRNLNETERVTVDSVKTDSPLCQSIRYSLTFGNRSRLQAEVKLTEGSELLEFAVTVHFRELAEKDHIPQLNFTVPVGYAVENYRYNVPFGVLDRPALKHDVPAGSYGVALPKKSADHPALMLIADSKYGFRGDENALSLALIRSSDNPDPYPEFGKHTVRLGIGLTAPDPTALRKAETRFNHPIAFCSARPSEGSLPLQGRLLELEGDAILHAVKTAEDTDGLILRIANPHEREKPFALTMHRPIKAAYFTDLNEQKIAPIPASGKRLSALLAPFGVETILIQF